jgi:hypothetical protein
MLARLHLSSFAALLALLALALCAPPARAQCNPDGLDGGPCCQPALAALPQFPAISSQGIRFICFDNCKTVLNAGYCVDIAQPTPILMGGGVVCGVYRTAFNVKLCGTSTILWTGKLTSHYSRNWQAFGATPGAVFTVWRFLLNGDLFPTSSLPTHPFFRPACQGTYPGVYFTGYIDYALDCASGTWQVAWSLDHGCDGIHHAPGTARPGAFHPTRSFDFVGPGAGFLPVPGGPATSMGTIFQQAVRWNNWTASPSICTFEEPAQGTFQAVQPGFCKCGSGPTGQYVMTFVNANGACGTTVNPGANGPFLQKKIGRWSNLNVFPGDEALRFDFGWLQYRNACTGALTQEWFEGVESLRGYAKFDFQGLSLGNQFEDLGSANLSNSSQAVRIGAPHVSYYMLNFNLQ